MEVRWADLPGIEENHNKWEKAGYLVKVDGKFDCLDNQVKQCHRHTCRTDPNISDNLRCYFKQ